jgi:acetyltransferase-like isoleucine patch superfamily enzyme
MNYPFSVRVAGFVRRRAGLVIVRLLHRRAEFGPLCDVRQGFRLTMARGAIVRFGARCSIDRGCTIEADGLVEVGADTVIGHHCTIAARSSVVIGSDCLLAEMVSIRDHDHAWSESEGPIRLQGESVAPVRIGSNVWLGSKVTVLRGVTIGDGVVVGANAVVTKDLPPGSVAVGIPARVVKHRP